LFLEMPGTQLNLAALARLSGIEAATCRAALQALEEAGFVGQTRDGMYMRRQSL
jgi:DNA-binding IclR family transcriptional regulator